MKSYDEKFLQCDISNSLLSTDEKALFAVRKHPVVLVTSISLSLLLSFLVLSVVTVLFVIFALPPPIILVSNLFLLWFTTLLVVKIFVDWYFHVYTITSKKILELSYKPFFTESINDVLLDQVRCTEIVVRQRGLLNHILDKGDIIITFDMPTHEDEFHFIDIVSPHEASKILGDLLTINRANFATQYNNMPVWYRYNGSINPHRNYSSLPV